MKTYEVEFEDLDLHWIVYKVEESSRIPMMRFVNREQAESWIEDYLNFDEGNIDDEKKKKVQHNSNSSINRC